MTRKSNFGDDWLLISEDPAALGAYVNGPVKGSAAKPVPDHLEIGGVPVVEATHEYVIRKARPRAQDR